MAKYTKGERIYIPARGEAIVLDAWEDGYGITRYTIACKTADSFTDLAEENLDKLMEEGNEYQMLREIRYHVRELTKQSKSEKNNNVTNILA